MARQNKVKNRLIEPMQISMLAVKIKKKRRLPDKCVGLSCDNVEESIVGMLRLSG